MQPGQALRLAGEWARQHMKKCSAFIMLTGQGRSVQRMLAPAGIQGKAGHSMVVGHEAPASPHGTSPHGTSPHGTSPHGTHLGHDALRGRRVTPARPAPRAPTGSATTGSGCQGLAAYLPIDGNERSSASPQTSRFKPLSLKCFSSHEWSIWWSESGRLGRVDRIPNIAC